MNDPDRYHTRDLATGEMLQWFEPTRDGLMLALEAAKDHAVAQKTNVMIEELVDGMVSDIIVICHPASYAE